MFFSACTTPGWPERVFGLQRVPSVLRLDWIIATAASALAVLPTSASLAYVAGLLQLCEAVSLS